MALLPIILLALGALATFGLIAFAFAGPSAERAGAKRLATMRERHSTSASAAMEAQMRRITGRQALDWGVATECVPDGELDKATDALVAELRTFSPMAQRTAKKLLNETEDASLSIAIELEGYNYSRLRQSDDFKEGVEAFHAKRAPRFKGS